MPTTLTELPQHPEVVGMYPDTRPLIEPAMPVLGLFPNRIVFGALSLDDLDAEVASRKARFATDQADQGPDFPVLWIDVGYVLDLELGLVYYFQIKEPDYTPPTAYTPPTP